MTTTGHTEPPARFATHPEGSRRPQRMQARVKSVVLSGVLSLGLILQSSCTDCNGDITLSIGLGSNCDPDRTPELTADNTTFMLAPTGTGSVTVTFGGSSQQNFKASVVQQSAGLVVSGGSQGQVRVGGTATWTFTVKDTEIPGTFLSFSVEAQDALYPAAPKSTVKFDITVLNPFTLSRAVVNGRPGTTFTGGVFVNRHGGFTGPVLLQVSGLPSGWSATSPAGVGNVLNLDIGAPGTALAAQYNATVTGTFAPAGATVVTTHSAPLVVDLASGGAPDFSLGASPAAFTVVRGSTGSSTISVVPTGTGLGDVTFGFNGPPGFVGTLTPASNGLSTGLSIAVPLATVPGAYSLSVVGTAGTLVRSTTLALTVVDPPDFTLGVTPGALTIAAGSQGSAVVAIGRTGSVGAVDLVYQNAPPGMTIAFASDPTVAANTPATILTTRQTPVGLHVVSITGIAAGLSRSTTLAVTVDPPPDDFSVQIAQSNVTLASGTMISIPVQVPRRGGVVGRSIDLTTVWPTANGVAWISPTPTVADTATLQIALTAAAAPGVHQVIVTGAFNSGTLIRRDTVMVTVAPPSAPDFTIIPIEKFVVIRRGGPSVHVNIEGRRVNGFAGAVAFSAPHLPAGSSASFVVTADPVNFTAVATLTATAASPLGAHAVVLRGTSGGATRDAIITVWINP